MDDVPKTQGDGEAELYLSVVIPAFNEEKRIGATLKRIHHYLGNKSLSYEVIVVSDGCDDGTEALVASLAEDLGRIRLVSYQPNRGKGFAAKQGVAVSRGRFILLSDADLSTPIEDSERLLSLCEKGVDLAYGSRALPDSVIGVGQSTLRIIMGRVFNAIVRALALPGVRDSQCGFKCFRAEAARDLFSKQAIEGFAFDVEVLMRAKKQGYNAQEVPIHWLNAESSTVHPFIDGAYMLFDLLKLKILIK